MIVGIALVACGSETTSTPASAAPTSAPEPTDVTGTAQTSTSIPVDATSTPLASTSSEDESSLKSEIFDFALEDLTIQVGTTVTWVNLDTAPHTATAGVSPDLSGEWDSGSLGKGKESSFTFNKVGAFPYFCTIHPFMTATITVVSPDSSTGTPTPAPIAATATVTVTIPPTPTPVPPSPTALTATQTPAPAESTQTPEPEPTTITSEILNFALEDLTIAVGTTVTWINGDSAPHTATAGVFRNLSGEWDSGTLSQSSQFSFTFNDAGSFAYFCTIHPSMTATITVTEPSG
ncbi:MAG: hypothetical protein IIC84_04420 [Chloroflexi bacterium]|nr:hypothetical protein [Chloroflexota bacterium]